MDYDASRREFFQQLVLGGAGIYLLPMLHSCDTDKYPPLERGTGKPPFNVWEEMIYALEKSPDNLVARRKALIATKNPKAISNFVRDSFQVIPKERGFFRHLGSSLNYGTKTALRCGLATPREKADILKEMLAEAGFEARVVLERTEISEKEVKDIVFNQQKPSFEPPINPSKYNEWAKQMGATETKGNFEAMPNAVEQANTLANSLLDKLDDKTNNKNSITTFHFGKNGVPSVAFTVNGKEQYAHVFDPSVPYGSLHPTNTDKKFRDAKEYKIKDNEVTVTLSCRKAFDTKKEVELISGTWNASELVGNQLKVNFLNNMPFEEQATKSISQITNFTPCFALQDIYQSEEYLAERSFLGEPITLEGEKIFQNTIIKENSETDTPSETINDVVSVEVKANPKTFPKVVLDIYPKNKEGKVVEGLKASDFSLTDNKKNVTGWMRQNVIAPKIMLLYDTSLSMPSAYRNKGIEKFLKQTQSLIRETYPYVKIILQETGSLIYTAHLKAAQTENDLILYATDGDNNDAFNPEFKNVYESGVPTIYLKVTKHRQKLFDKLAENTGATFIPADDQESTKEQIQATIDQLSFPPYVFTYHSFNAETAHTAEVSLKEIQQKAEDRFRFPKQLDNAVGNRMIGLYLDVKIGNQTTIRRVLAGWDYKIAYHEKPNAQMANDVHEMLLGGAVLAFEREGPTLSLQLTEYLKTLMSNRNWFEAHQAGDIQSAVAELGKGIHSYPSVLLSMMQPLQNNVSKTSVTYPQGYRVGILKFVPGLYKKETHVSFDYLPTSYYVSITKSGKDAFSETARKTAQLALLENKVFETSTLSELKGKELIFDRKAKGDDRYSRKALGEEYRYFRERIFRGPLLNFFDASTENKSFWRIDHRTGELYGVLPDQTGGGGKGIQAQLENLQTVINEYQKVISAINLGMMVAGGGLALGMVSAYSVTLVKLYALASEALILMDAGGMDGEIDKAMQALACNIYKEIYYMGLGPVGAGMSGVENLIGMMGGSYSFVKC